MRTRFAFASCVLALAACYATTSARQTPALGTPFSGAPAMMASPAGPGSAEPNLAVDARGRMWLSWLETVAAGGHRLQLSSRPIDGAWAPPLTITSGTNLLANWADFPSVFPASDGTLAAHWLERGATRSAYGVRVATSSNGGRTWAPTITPHRDNSATEHGFVSFYDAPGAGVGLIWLDGREMAGGHAAAGHGAGAMALRATTLKAPAAMGAETVIDARVCDCCQTSAARTADGVMVAYRDRSDKEVRDIVVSRLVKGAWTPAVAVGADNWEINGCPVNGPVVAAEGRAVAVAWFTAVGNTPRTYVAFSSDAGQTFGAPIRVDAGVTLGRVGLVMLGQDRVLVSSIERAEKGAHLVVRDVRRDGRTSAPVAIGPISPDRPSGFPRMVHAGGRLVVAWTDVQPGKPTQVLVAQARIQP